MARSRDSGWERRPPRSRIRCFVVAVSWQMYELTDSALNLGLIGLVQVTPYFLFVLWAGHVADVHDGGASRSSRR